MLNFFLISSKLICDECFINFQTLDDNINILIYALFDPLYYIQKIVFIVVVIGFDK